jgi:hypothetical protein
MAVSRPQTVSLPDLPRRGQFIATIMLLRAFLSDPDAKEWYVERNREVMKASTDSVTVFP